MAQDKIQMQYDLHQNMTVGTKASGKWYAQPVVTNTLSLKGFANHIHSHSGTYKTSTIKGVMEEMVECLSEMVSQGVGVKLDGLGTFRPWFEGEGVENPEDYNIQEHLKGIHIRFLPENTKDEELTSRKFMSKCSLKRRFPVAENNDSEEDEGEGGEG